MSQARKERTKRSDPVQKLQRTVRRLKGKNECLNKQVKTLEEENRHLKLQLKEYREKFANPYIAAGLGYIDKVIFPHETRPLICKGLDMLASKRQTRPPKKHGNIPL